MDALNRLMRIPLVIVIAALSGCQSSTEGYVQVPQVPTWIAPTNTATYTTSQVMTAIQAEAPFAWIDTTDSVFVPVSHEWLEKTLAWSWEFGKATGLGSWTAESWDCDKISAAFTLAANIAASRAGVKAQPLVARIFVSQEVAFGNVPAGGAHALVGVLTDRGIYVTEPQSRALVSLEKYPNRKTIFRVRLGG